MGKMLKNGRMKFRCGYYPECSCHSSKQLRRNAKKAAKRMEARQWKKDQDAR